MKKSLLFAVLSMAGLAWAAEKYTKDQLQARFPEDLGPSEINVSPYPQKQQENYLVFKQTCSQCHTLARPINAEIVLEKDWRRYVQRMHLRTKVRVGKLITKDQARMIIEFLAYDAKIRKVDHKAEFETQSKQLEVMFKDVQQERKRVQQEEDQKKVKPLPLDAGSGVRPQP